MSEETSGRRDRRGRRRYFRPKKGEPAPQSKPAESRPEAGKMRRARRRARSRQRMGEEAKVVSAEREEPYIAPAAVFIYTHTSDPEMREAYEFRPEHFSSVGRRLEDYQIDLATLLPDDKRGPDGLPLLATAMPKPDYNWDDWEEWDERPFQSDQPDQSDQSDQSEEPE